MADQPSKGFFPFEEGDEMLIEVSKVPKKGLFVKHSFSPSELGLVRNGEFSLKKPAPAKLEIVVKGRRCEIKGEVSFELELICSRCLEEFPFLSSSSFELVYLPRDEMPTEPDLELTPNDLKVSFYQDDEIDLSEVVREQIILAIPMKPICSPNCKGLCPMCGANLNQAPCNCQREAIDPRLAPLKDLKARLKIKG